MFELSLANNLDITLVKSHSFNWDKILAFAVELEFDIVYEDYSIVIVHHKVLVCPTEILSLTHSLYDIYVIWNAVYERRYVPTVNIINWN